MAWLGGVRGAQRDGNPALGLRGIRLSLAEPELLRTQLRALARAAASGPLSVMLPFVTLPEELDAARAYLDAACDALAVEGYVHARPQLGVMIETPAEILQAGGNRRDTQTKRCRQAEDRA
ncbi:MAG: putative PEP-binding protein, partial [Pseudomonadota bacterium]